MDIGLVNMGRVLALVLLLALGTSCCKCPPSGGGGPLRPPGDGVGSLYDRIGGGTFQTIATDTLRRAVTDTRVNLRRAGVPGTQPWTGSAASTARFREQLGVYLARLAGGPVPYEGRDMRSTHEHMKITSAEFDRFVAALESACLASGVAPADASDLAARVRARGAEFVELP